MTLPATHVVAANHQLAGCQVDVEPPQREELGPSQSGDHHEPDQRAPVLVLSPSSGDDTTGLLDSGRVRLWHRLAGFLRDQRRVRLDPFPPHRGRQRRADREVHMADRRRRQRPALVRRTFDHRAAHLAAVMLGITCRWRPARRSAVPDDPAVMRPSGPVVYREPPVAAGSAPAQLGVEVLQHLGRDLAEGYVAERRLDVEPRVRLVALPGVRLDLVDPQPGVEGSTERRAGPRLLLGLHLGA
jgi:hypothetical protein